MKSGINLRPEFFDHSDGPQMAHGPVLSVVDYASWEKGYMPPNEHVLIDQLAYRGARVVLSSDMGEYAYWVVIRSDKPHGRLLPVMKALEQAIGFLKDEPETTPETPSTEIQE